MAKTLSERLEQARNIRDAIVDRMEGRIAENHNSYSIDDRSISKMTMAELQEALVFQEGEVRRLERLFARSSGRSSMIKIRF